MKESSLQYLRCARCSKKLVLEKLAAKKEVSEGFLFCSNCNLTYPIISKVPILWDDFTVYLSRRAGLGGTLLLEAKSPKMKKFVKESLSHVKKNVDDITQTEKRWVQIYQNNSDSKFYLEIKKLLKRIPRSEFVLEHGCSIGLVTEHLAKRHDNVFGIDSSFFGIKHAKKSKRKKIDYFVADSLYPPFGNQKFGLVVALNLLEIIEPAKLLKVITNQAKHGSILLSSPYDYERGASSVKNRINEKDLRKTLKNLGFQIDSKTKRPKYIQWKLNLHYRATLEYKVDVVLTRK